MGFELSGGRRGLRTGALASYCACRDFRQRVCGVTASCCWVGKALHASLLPVASLVLAVMRLAQLGGGRAHARACTPRRHVGAGQRKSAVKSAVAFAMTALHARGAWEAVHDVH